MCRHCELLASGLSPAEAIARRRIEYAAAIEKHGWVVVGVQDAKPEVYTIGLTLKGLPELYLDATRLGIPRAHYLIDSLAARSAERPLDPTTAYIIEGHTVTVSRLNRTRTKRKLPQTWDFFHGQMPEPAWCVHVTLGQPTLDPSLN